MGENIVSVNYPGDNKYSPSSNQTSFNVRRINTNLSIDTIDDTTIGSDITISGILKDEFGNELVIEAADGTTSAGIYIDTNKPRTPDVTNTATGTALKEGKYKNSVSFTLSTTAGTKTQYSTDGGSEWTDYTSTVTLTEDASLVVRAIDYESKRQIELLEQGEKIKVQRLASLDKPRGLHRLPFQKAVDMLLGDAKPASKFGLRKAEFVAALVNSLSHMYVFYIYIHGSNLKLQY